MAFENSCDKNSDSFGGSRRKKDKERIRAITK